MKNSVNSDNAVSGKASKIKSSKTERIVFGIVIFLFLVYAIYILYPFGFIINSSLKENGRAFVNDSVSIAWPMYFSNYIKAFKELTIENNSFFRMILNSLWYAFGNTFLSILSSTLVAYVVSKYNFKGRNFIYSLVLVVMMIPIYGAMPARYRLMSQLNWLNSPLYIISSANGFDFAFLVIYAFFKNVSWNYAEAAFIDGASHFQVFLKIMVPLVIPSVTAIFVTNFIGNWNAYDGPLLYLPKMPTLSAGLFAYNLKMQHGGGNVPVYFAGVTLSLIPIVTIFLAFQNTIMTKVYTGGLKG